jgi:colicin import membrane protein
MPAFRKISLRLFLSVAVIHILIIGCAVKNRHAKTKDENMFRVKIGGEELSHGEEVGQPERRSPGRLPESEPEPEPVPEEPKAEPAPPPPPKEPGIDYEALNRAKKKKAEEARKKKLEAEKKRKAELDRKKKEEARKKRLEKKKKLDAEKKRKAEEERKRKERESVYQPDQSGPIGGGGTNLNPNVPVGNKDKAQAYGKQDNRSPGGGARVQLAQYAEKSLLPYLQSRWKQPPDSLLGGKRPSVDIVLTISASGKVQHSSIKRSSGVAAMDDSVKRLLAGLDILPRPPAGAVSITITLKTE